MISSHLMVHVLGLNDILSTEAYVTEKKDFYSYIDNTYSWKVTNKKTKTAGFVRLFAQTPQKENMMDASKYERLVCLLENVPKEYLHKILQYCERVGINVYNQILFEDESIEDDG